MGVVSIDCVHPAPSSAVLTCALPVAGETWDIRAPGLEAVHTIARNGSGEGKRDRGLGRTRPAALPRRAMAVLTGEGVKGTVHIDDMLVPERGSTEERASADACTSSCLPPLLAPR